MKTFTYKTVIIVSTFLLSGLAYINSFTQDDAFITYRYSKNLVNHGVLNWNIIDKDKVEGYSNFLWMMVMTIPFILKLDPVSFSKIVSLLFYIITLYTISKSAEVLFTEKRNIILLLLMIGTNYTFLIYATGGLETMMQTMFIVLIFYTSLIITTIEANLNKYIVFSVLSSLAILTRNDSSILLLIIIFFTFNKLFKDRRTQAIKSFLFVFLVVQIMVFLPYFLWKIYYYEQILPNTYYIKAKDASLVIIKNGVLYLYQFLDSYLLIFPILFSIVYLKEIKTKESILFISLILLWSIYIVKIGGDFMEFRLMVVVIPFYFLLLTLVLSKINNLYLTVSILLLCFLGSINHILFFKSISGIESKSQLSNHLFNKNEDWIGIGKKLYDNFHKQPVRIATTAAGVIPFYSELYTIDMLGLNDKNISKYGKIISSRPGHSKLATLEYLIDKKVNFIIGHPFMVLRSYEIKDSTSLGDFFNSIRVDFNEFKKYYKEVVIVKMVVNEDYSVMFLYLVKDDKIDEILKNKDFKIFRITL